jgi:ribonuclease P/MRP protein subunit RPP40
MHIGHNNPMHEYTMTNKSTQTTHKHIMISNDLKAKHQVNKAAGKGNRMLGLMKRTFKSRDSAVWLKLYLTYIRSQMEFAVQAWNPYLKRDIKQLEQVQRRATRVAHSMRGHEYSERLKKLGLTTLAERRARGDLIQKFKLENELDDIEWHFPPTTKAPSKTRRGQAGQQRPQLVPEINFHCLPRANFFNNRIVTDWNDLPAVVVDQLTVSSFKKHLDEYRQKKRNQE